MTTVVTTTYPSITPARTLTLRGGEDAYRDGSFSITPIMVSDDSVFGAEISGIDWIAPIPAEQIEEVRKRVHFSLIPLARPASG